MLTASGSTAVGALQIAATLGVLSALFAQIYAPSGVALAAAFPVGLTTAILFVEFGRCQQTFDGLAHALTAAYVSGARG